MLLNEVYSVLLPLQMYMHKNLRRPGIILEFPTSQSSVPEHGSMKWLWSVNTTVPMAKLHLRFLKMNLHFLKAAIQRPPRGARIVLSMTERDTVGSRSTARVWTYGIPGAQNVA